MKEYLLFPHIRDGPASAYQFSEMSANITIAESCLTYLLYFDSEPLCEEHLFEYPLLRYVANQWSKHAANIPEPYQQPVLDSLILKLMSRGSNCYVNWLKLRYPMSDKMYFFEDFDRTEVSAPLYYASYLGLDRIVKRLVESGADVNEMDEAGPFLNALQAVAYSGKESIVRYLCEKGAVVNVVGGELGTALQAAAWTGENPDSQAVVQILLEYRAVVNVDDSVGYEGDLGTALHAAAHGGHYAVLRILLENGADVHAKDYCGSALMTAVCGIALFSDFTEVVEILLQ